MPKLNREQAAAIRARAAAGESRKALAAEFGVSVPAVRAVLMGQIYRPEGAPSLQRQPGPGTTRELVTTADRVLAILTRRSSALSKRELSEVLGISTEAVTTALSRLRKRDVVEKIGSGQGTRYRLTDAARPAPVPPRGDRPRNLGFGNRLRQLLDRGQLAVIRGS